MLRLIALRSIAVPALKRAQGFKFRAARPFNDDSRVSNDVANARSWFLRSIAEPVIDRTARETLVFSCA